MATEREQPTQEKKTLQEWVKEVFEKIFQKIRELTRKRERSAEEEELLNTLLEENRARREAYNDDPYYKETQGVIDGFKEILGKAREELQKSPEAEVEQKSQAARKAYEEAWEKAQAHLKKEPADFPRRLHRLDDIAKHDVTHALERERIGLDKTSEVKGGVEIKKIKEPETKKSKKALPGKEKDEAEKRSQAGREDEDDEEAIKALQRAREKLEEAEKRGEDGPKTREDEEAIKAQHARFREKQMENAADPEVIEGMRKFRHMDGMSPYDLFNPDEEKKIQSDFNFREQAFQRIINRFGNDPNRHFREADLKTQMGWTQFSLAILELKDGRDILQEYTYRLGFEEQVHNLDMFFRGHSKVVDLPHVLGQFESRMLDMALRQKGAVVAFRAYEQAFNRLIMTEGRLPPSKIGMDPDDKKIWINQWVRQQVRNIVKVNPKEYGLDTLQAYCQEHRDDEGNVLDYEQELEKHIDTMTRTGWKVFLFTMRGDEIQGSTIQPRIGPAAPWHEDTWRRLDPLSLPTKYWKGRVGPEGFLNINDETTATALWYYATGEEKYFKTSEEYEAALEKAREEGKVQLNFFDTGGILSVSDWRSTYAMKHIPKALWPFMGIEMERKLLQEKEFNEKPMDQISARQKAFEHARIRNPFALFRLADEQDQDAILRTFGVEFVDLSKIDREKERMKYKAAVEANIEARKKFFEANEGKSLYDDMSQALQRLAFRQQQEMAQILKLPKDQQEAAAVAFAQRELTEGLDFGFVTDTDQKKMLNDFVQAIQTRFGKGEGLDKLVEKRYPFSLGTEDVPLELMRFLEVGDIGLQRRFRDLGEISQSSEALWAYIKDQGVILQKEESIIENLSEIHKGLYGAGVPSTDNIMEAIVSRTLEMLAEDEWQNWLPWPANAIRNKYGFTSKAEKMYGQYHMSLSSNDMRLFLEKIIGAGVFTKEKVKELRKKFYKKHGLRAIDIWKGRIYEYSLMIPVGLLASAIIILVKQFKEDIEETTKES